MVNVSTLSRWWIVIAVATLTGLACFGKGFSYLGIGQLRVTEMMLLLGVLTISWKGLVTLRKTYLMEPAAWFMLLFILWCMLRTIPGLGEHGFLALRDAAQWGYALVSILIILELGKDPDPTLRLTTFLRWFTPIFLIIAPITFLAGRWLEPFIPSWPGSTVPIIYHKPGDVLVHLGGIIVGLVMVISPLRNQAVLAISAVVVLLLMMPFNRAGMIACLMAVMMAFVFKPFSFWWIKSLAAAVVILFALWFTGWRIAPPDYNGRMCSFAQYQANFGSLASMVSPRSRTPDVPLKTTPIPVVSLVQEQLQSASSASSGYAGSHASSQVTPQADVDLLATAPTGSVEPRASQGTSTRASDSVAPLPVAILRQAQLPPTGVGNISSASSGYAGSHASSQVTSQAGVDLLATAPTGSVEPRASQGTSTRASDSVAPPSSLTQVKTPIAVDVAPKGNLDDTSRWRITWWKLILTEAKSHGPLWTGIGYGQSLREATGYTVAKADVRSPHSIHMTILGRTGWIGLVLWGGLLLTWFTGMAAAWLRSRGRESLRAWIVVATAWVLAMLVNASFDVYLEGPSGGIWFWTLIGVGLVLMSVSRRTHTASAISPDVLPDPEAPPPSRRIAGIRVDGTSYADAVSRIRIWSGADHGRYVCAANVHMAMEAWDDPGFARVVDGAALVCPDGMPLVASLRAMGVSGQTRVYGPTLMLETCLMAAAQGIPIGLHGGTQECLDALVPELRNRFPGIRIEWIHSPPFRALSREEDAEVVARIRASGVRILFVGLGCPKQERWMADHRERLPLVQIGVGAAFAFHTGMVAQAPHWMQSLALEWLFRLVVEPRRLWRRYVIHNPRFLVIAGWNIVCYRMRVR